MDINWNWKLLTRSLLVVVLLASTMVIAIPSSPKPVLAAGVVENLFYDLATDSLSDWNLEDWGASLDGIRIESSGNFLYYTRNDLAINQNAFQMEAVVSGSAVAPGSELGARMWVKFHGNAGPGMIFNIELRFIRQGGGYCVVLMDGNTGQEKARLKQNWTGTSPRVRVRIKHQKVLGSDYIFLQAEESSSWDNPAQPNNLNDQPNSLGVEMYGVTGFSPFPDFLGTGEEVGFGNPIPGNYYSEWESIHLTICNDDTTVLPYWPTVPPTPTLVHDDKGMDNPQGIDFSCDLTSSGYLSNDSVTPVLDADGTTYYGETRLNPGNEAWCFDGLNDDQTVYGRIVVTDVSGRSTTGPDGSTVIPNRTTSTIPEIDDILTFFYDSVADESLVGNGPGNSANGRLDSLRNMIEVSGKLINRGRIAGACQLLQVAYLRVDGNPNPPDFASGPATLELANMIQQLINSLED